MSRKGKRRAISLVRGIFLLLVCLACLLPFVWMIMVKNFCCTDIEELSDDY